MSYYQPSDEPNSERLLMITLDRSPEYGHVQARVVRRSLKTYTDPDTNRIVYADDSGTGYRNATWLSGKPNALYVDDLVLHSQSTIRNWDGKKEPRNLYGIELRFKPHDVDYKRALRMADTFKALHKKLDKINDAYGYAKDADFTEHAIRLASAMGIKKFVFYKKGKSGGWLTDDTQFDEVSVRDLRYYVDRLMDQMFPVEETQSV